MRPLHWVIALCAMVAVSAVGRADEPADPPPPIINTEREGPCDYLLPPCPERAGARCTVDVIIGLPTGFRFQRAVDDDRRWHLEGFVGLEFIFPIAGVGIRRRYEPLCGQHDALIVAPGIDGYALYNIFHDSDFRRRGKKRGAGDDEVNSRPLCRGTASPKFFQILLELCVCV